jgi:putative tricarboxylic transport membrane protein
VTPLWTDARRDRLLAVVAAAFAAQYIAAARGIEDSLLADAVGAGGVPQGVGLLMLLAALALFAKSFRHDGAAHAANDNDARMPWAAVLRRCAALVLILVVYGVLLPKLGYPLSVSLLVLAVGHLAGAALRWPLLAIAAVSGPLLWAMFDWALKVRMPVGSLWG